MANRYDVYLRKRLTEFDIIIQNLPYRDGLVAHTKMYLDSIVNYLYLQKFIVGEHNMALQADIDNLLERVFNIFKSNSYLTVSANAVMEKPAGVSSEMFLDSSNFDINEESFNTFSEFMNLTTAALKYDIQKSIGTGSIRMALTTKSAATIKTAFEKFDKLLNLDAIAIPSSEKFAEAKTNIQLQTDPFSIYYLVAVQCEALMNLTCAMDFEIWFSLGNAANEIYLTVHMGDTQEEKFCSADNVVVLLSQVNAALIGFISLDSADINLYSSVEAGLKRYRKVAEVDPLAVSEMDSMSVEELDYVVLA